MILITSKNGEVGIRRAMAILRAGGSAIDAVVAGIEPVESNREDHTVGLGGLPNLLGEVELEASLMDGATRDVGAAAVLRRCEHPIRVARAVLERLPHVLIVGPGAERLARAIGQPEAALLTEEARATFTETQQEVIRALGAMRPRARQALLLREYGGLSTQEIGAEMGLSRQAVKSLLFRARGEFRAIYEKQGAD